jgi:hypothetical protein
VTAADYADFSAPQANANTIAATGVPLLTLPGAALSVTQPINAGASYTSGFLPMDQPSYEIAISVFETGAGGAAPLRVQMQWYDDTTSNLISQETYFIWGGISAGDHSIFGRGPVKGSFLVVFVFNDSVAMQYTAVIRAYQRSHMYTRDEWRSFNYATSSAASPVAVNDLTADLAGYRLTTIAGGGVDTSELPLYFGPCYLFFQTASNAADMTLTVQSSANYAEIGSGAKFLQFLTSATGVFGGVIVLPRYQCRIQMKNGNAAAQACFYSLHTYDQAC